MRTFVALEISDKGVIDSLVESQNELARTGADIKLVERENLHFTMRFLGEITQAQATDADERLKRRPPAGAVVEVRGMGAFPNPGRPNVVWVGVSPEDERLVAPIAAFVNQSLEGIGEKDDRPFKAHVTLARVRSRRGTDRLAEAIRSSADRSYGRTPLTTLKLKESKLTPQGAVYSDIGVYHLG